MSLTNRINASQSKLGVPACPDNDELHLDDSSTFMVLDRAIASFVNRGHDAAPLVIGRNDENVTIIGLPQIKDKGICVLVVYENGQTERYEQLTQTSKGCVVAIRSGRIVELYC